MIVFTSCNNCGATTSWVSNRMLDETTWTYANTTHSVSNTLIPCCGGSSANPCVTFHMISVDQYNKCLANKQKEGFETHLDALFEEKAEYDKRRKEYEQR